MTRQCCIIMFDIDGTLIDSAKAGVSAMTQALVEQGAIKEKMRSVNFAGSTDWKIISDALQISGIEPANELIETISERYLDYLAKALQDTNEYRILPGVFALLDEIHALSQHAPVYQTLGTGNLEKGARLKLAKGDLNHYFSSGGFGSDAVRRSDVLACGIQKVATQHNLSIKSKQVLIIGDTPRDIKAGQELSCPVLAVATGRFSLDELALCKPDYLFQDLNQAHDSVISFVRKNLQSA